MSKGLALSIIILVVLAAGLWYLMEGNGDNTLIRDIKKGAGIEDELETPVPTGSSLPTTTQKPAQPSSKQVPAEFQSGNSRFSRGSCTQDADCSVGGCSGEVCSSDPGVITTCEFSPSFPGLKRGYTCGCVNQKCGWR